MRLALALFLFMALAAGASAAPGLRIAPGQDGLPAQITWPGGPRAGALRAPCRLTVTDGKDALPARPLRAAGAGRREAEWPEQRLRLALAYGADGTITFTLRSGAGEQRTLALSLLFPLRADLERAFFPASSEPHLSLAGCPPEISYGYGGGSGTWTALPLGAVYAPKADWGLALFGDHHAPIPGFSITLRRVEGGTDLVANLPGIACPPNADVARTLYLAPTGGDWRPALAAALARFPEVFEPGNKAVDALHGPFVCSGGAPPDDAIARWKAQGTRVVEIHGTAPFYGLYVPDREPWLGFCDDAWHTLKKSAPAAELPPEGASWSVLRDFAEKHRKPNLTLDAVRDYIRRLHRQGVKGLIYFNPTEAWAPWAAERFPGDRVMTGDGKTVPTWYESVCMIPDKDRSWGRYVLDQLRGELAQYPELDGVFFDQSAGGGHDLTALCAEGCKEVRARGGICWWNGPYNVELAALADGMMSEGGGTGTYRAMTEVIQYYGIAGKPIVSLGPATPEAYSELLSHGLIPQPVEGPTKEMGERWFPLFRYLHNRRWVLTAHALDAGPRVAANLYRTPEGNYVVPLTTPEAVPLLDVPVAVRVADGASIRAAYLLTPELMGAHKLPLRREGKAVAVRIPRLKTAGLLVLARTGVFAALDGGLHVVAGAPAKPTWAVENWTAAPVKAHLELAAKDAKITGDKTVPPGGRASVVLATQAPEETAGRFSLRASAVVGGKEMGGPVELCIDPPLVLSLSVPETVRDDQPVPAGAQLLSHAAKPLEVVLRPGPGFEWEPKERHVTARPEEPLVVRFAGRPAAAGLRRVRLAAEAAGLRAGASAEVDVLATALAPGGLEAVRSADLLLDVFGSDGGPYADKPILLNGVTVGNVPPGSGDTWAARSMPLPPAAVRALREENEIAVGNKVGDAFKVRNLSLRLHLRGGVSASSSVDRGVYTGTDSWAFGEGQQFPSGQPIAGIRVKIPVDPRRQERYEEPFGIPKSGRLVLEVFGSEGGVREHKPVALNGVPLGNLPTAPELWTEASLPLTPDALASLGTENSVQIENSDPADAFKVRRARLEIENTRGERVAGETDPGVYTSCGWEYAEGTVGSPIRFTLRFQPRE